MSSRWDKTQRRDPEETGRVQSSNFWHGHALSLERQMEMWRARFWGLFIMATLFALALIGACVFLQVGGGK